MSLTVRAIAPHLFNRRMRKHRTKMLARPPSPTSALANQPYDIISSDTDSLSSASSSPTAPTSLLPFTVRSTPAPAAIQSDSDPPATKIIPRLLSVVAATAAFIPTPVTRIVQSFVGLVPKSVRTATLNFTCRVAAVVDYVEDWRVDFVEFRRQRRKLHHRQ
ncbi:hypothetical protein K438DRAFT_1974901 [Mycena galopus ATCC 62051]|nr:hypothetical protein K438DRAFT_1974901 [Mycena galopus ATCC 62051]